MAHRYLYYIQCRPVISDSEYDRMESDAMPGLPYDSPLRLPGSDAVESYPPDVIIKALKLNCNKH